MHDDATPSTHGLNSALLMLTMKGHHLDSASVRQARREGSVASRGRRLPLVLRMSGTLLFSGVVLFFIGFALFATHIGRLSTPNDPPTADAIIVLTGGQARIDAAVDLLKSGKGKRLLISGVHPSTTLEALQQATGGDARLFSCCVDIDHAALDMIGNAEESAKWVRGHDYDRVILVTNNYHMPRSLLEMQRLLETRQLAPYPVVNRNLDNGGWIAQPDALRVLFTEYNKYLLAMVRSLLPRQIADGSFAAMSTSLRKQ